MMQHRSNMDDCGWATMFVSSAGFPVHKLVCQETRSNPLELCCFHESVLRRISIASCTSNLNYYRTSLCIIRFKIIKSKKNTIVDIRHQQIICTCCTCSVIAVRIFCIRTQESEQIVRHKCGICVLRKSRCALFVGTGRALGPPTRVPNRTRACGPYARVVRCHLGAAHLNTVSYISTVQLIHVRLTSQLF
jgi:hypothetical protein